MKFAFYAGVLSILGCIGCPVDPPFDCKEDELKYVPGCGEPSRCEPIPPPCDAAELAEQCRCLQVVCLDEQCTASETFMANEARGVNACSIIDEYTVIVHRTIDGC